MIQILGLAPYNYVTMPIKQSDREFVDPLKPGALQVVIGFPDVQSFHSQEAA